MIVLEPELIHSTTFLTPLKNGWLFSWALGEGGKGGRFHQKATTARAAQTAAGMVYTQVCGIAVKYMQVKLQIKSSNGPLWSHTSVVSLWVVVTILGEMRRALARPIELPETQKTKNKIWSVWKRHDWACVKSLWTHMLDDENDLHVFLDNERLMLDKYKELACHQRAFNLCTVPDCQGRTSSNKLRCSVYILLGVGILMSSDACMIHCSPREAKFTQVALSLGPNQTPASFVGE